MSRWIGLRDLSLNVSLVFFVAGCSVNNLVPPTEGTAGIVVHIDPTTGRFLPEPPAGNVTPPPATASLKASPPPLYETASPTPGGGVMIDLNGQFHTPLVATINADGKVTLNHASTIPGQAESR